MNETLQWLCIAITALAVFVPVVTEFKKAGQDEDE